MLPATFNGEYMEGRMLSEQKKCTASAIEQRVEMAGVRCSANKEIYTSHIPN